MSSLLLPPAQYIAATVLIMLVIVLIAGMAIAELRAESGDELLLEPGPDGRLK